MLEGLGEREGRLPGVLALGLKCPGEEPCTLIVGTVGEVVLSGTLNDVAGLFGEGCKVMLCNLALRLLLNEDSRLACRLVFAVYSCKDSIVLSNL